MAVSTEEGEVELEISDDPHDCTRLDVSSIPLTVTMSKVIDLNKTICYGQICYTCSLIISVQKIVLNSFEWQHHGILKQERQIIWPS